MALINGSPRGTSSNTRLLTDQLTKGFVSVDENAVIIEYFLKNKPGKEILLDAFDGSDILLLAFPLYTDAMPGITKEFFEQLQGIRGKYPSLKIGYIVQSGFPESHHSTFVARYLERFTLKLGCNYLGTAIKGGVEGIAIQPAWMTKKMFSLFRALGENLAVRQEFDREILRKMAHPQHFSKAKAIGFRILSTTGLFNFYWNGMLKKNKAYNKRFDKPY